MDIFALGTMFTDLAWRKRKQYEVARLPEEVKEGSTTPLLTTPQEEHRFQPDLEVCLRTGLTNSVISDPTEKKATHQEDDRARSQKPGVSDTASPLLYRPTACCVSSPLRVWCRRTKGAQPCAHSDKATERSSGGPSLPLLGRTSIISRRSAAAAPSPPVS